MRLDNTRKEAYMIKNPEYIFPKHADNPHTRNAIGKDPFRSKGLFNREPKHGTITGVNTDPTKLDTYTLIQNGISRPDVVFDVEIIGEDNYLKSQLTKKDNEIEVQRSIISNYKRLAENYETMTKEQIDNHLSKVADHLKTYNTIWSPKSIQ